MKIGREPTSTELQIVAAEWSEHCFTNLQKNISKCYQWMAH